MARRRGPPPLRPARPREDERRQLAARWEENRKRREAGWPAAPNDIELRQKASQMVIERRGADALAEFQKIKNRSAKLCDTVEKWNRKLGKDGKVKLGKDGKAKDVKDISGGDVMKVLEIAGALTNHPAYAAARKALILHRLDRGGLRTAFRELQDRHGHDQVPSLYGAVHDTVQEYMDEFGYKYRQAIEHIVADLGMPGTSFDDAVDKVRKAYPKRNEVREVHEAERQQYLEELSGLRDPNNSR